MVSLLAAVWLGPSLAAAFDPAAGDFSKAEARDIRLVAYNTFRTFISDTSADAAYGRVLRAINPDVVVMEEILRDDVTNQEILDRLNTLLPNADDSSWHIHRGQASDSGGFIHNLVAARWPLSLTRTDTDPPGTDADERGATLALVDLPDALYARDIYLVGIHLKSSGGAANQALRQRSADAIAAWLGDARQPGGLFTLADDTPMIILGDANLVNGPNSPPELTLITGDIDDEATFGPDVKGDWDNTNLTDLTPADPHTGDTDTWRSDSTNPTSRLDRFFYTDSVLEVANAFILNTRTMSSAQRLAAGLQFLDTDAGTTADHLPIIVDIRIEAPPEGPLPLHGLLTN